MVAGIDDAVVLAEQFFARILRYCAKLVVDEGDLPLRIGDGHDGVFVQRGFEVADLPERGLEFFVSLALFTATRGAKKKLQE